ncbi:uncharacterized protein NPIL_441191 [Nephila pilipes]|uniref:Transposase n=1 Tax=Nephila pilipes TaxID=299642 RepID=A0A8X6P3P4_NEPPI|nr:uncharacterized protein NPIL_441191 [Nephila pilipes]
MQTRKRPLTVADLIKLVERFEKTVSLEDRVRSGRPSLRQTLWVCETLASESSVGSNSAREAGRRLAYHHPRYATFFMEFLIRPLFFETQCPVNGWKKVTVNAQDYLTLLCEKVVPYLREKDALCTVTFMQDGATSHTAKSVKEFLIQTFGEEIINSKRCKSP